MTHDQIERMRIRLKLGQTLDAEECERLLDTIDALRGQVSLAYQMGWSPLDDDGHDAGTEA